MRGFLVGHDFEAHKIGDAERDGDRDIGVPPDPAPMDFSAWFEAFLDGRWYTFDARHNHPRIGRVVMARGRDAADVAISVAFGVANLVRFEVVTFEQLN